MFTFPKNEHIHIKRIEEVEAKLRTIEKDGVEHLHIVTDFDMTLTKYLVDKKRNMSSHSLLDSNERNPELSAKMRALFQVRAM